MAGMSDVQPAVDRTKDWIDREYGAEKWPRVQRLIDERIAAEPGACLSRVLRAVARDQWATETPLATRQSVVDGGVVELPRSAAFGAAQGLVLDVLASVSSDATGLVVELGAGWSWHLLSFWLAGGPRAATYVGAEYTAAGRRAACSLAALDARLDYRAVDFDYHEPRLEGLGEAEHAVVFTQHSIEQIAYVKPALVDAIRGVARQVTCVHFEPVGWQLHGGALAGSSAAYAQRHDYNRDLVEILRAEQAAGRITIDAIAREIVGVNHENASTIIVWRAPA